MIEFKFKNKLRKVLSFKILLSIDPNKSGFFLELYRKTRSLPQNFTERTEIGGYAR